MTNKTIFDIIDDLATKATSDSGLQAEDAGHSLQDMATLLEQVTRDHPEAADQLTGLLDQLRQMQTLTEAVQHAQDSGDTKAMLALATQVTALSPVGDDAASDDPSLAALEQALDSADPESIATALDAVNSLNTTECRFGMTPIGLALMAEGRSAARIAAFLNRGARADFATECGNTPLHFVPDYMGSDDPEIAQIIALLLRHGANMEAVNGHGFTPLMKAVIEGTAEEVRALLDAGADASACVGASDSPCFAQGTTCLSQAVNRPEVVQHLLDHAAGPHDTALREIDTELRRASEVDYPEYHDALRASRALIESAQRQ